MFACCPTAQPAAKAGAVQLREGAIALPERPVRDRLATAFRKRCLDCQQPSIEWMKRSSALPQGKAIGLRKTLHIRLSRCLLGGHCAQRRFCRLSHAGVALPAFVFQLDVLDGDGIGIGIEIGQGLILGNPTSIDLVSDD